MRDHCGSYGSADPLGTMSMVLVVEIGETATKPVASGPTKLLMRSIVAINMQTSSVRKGTSWHLRTVGGMTISQKPFPTQRQIGKTTVCRRNRTYRWQLRWSDEEGDVDLYADHSFR